jgi:uncharacterized membrane protein
MKLRKLLDDSGAATALVLMFLLGIVAVAGLVIDGGFLFSSRRALQSTADGAARAGAMAVDEWLLRESGGKEVKLSPEGARQAVADYLTRAGFRGEFDIEAAPGRVRVVLRKELEPLVLSITGIHEVSAKAESTAEPRSGITGAEE